MLFCFFLLWLTGGSGEVLVLKDGKTIPIAESFEIKKNFVHFKDIKGSLMMLPLKIVDLEETKKRNATAKTEAASAPKATPKPIKSDDLVAHARTRPTETQLTDATLSQFNAENPRDDVNPAAVGGGRRHGYGASTRNAAHTQRAQDRRRKSNHAAIRSLEQQVRAKKDEIRKFQTDPAAHWSFDYRKEHNALLKGQLATLQKRLIDLKNYVRTGPSSAPLPPTASQGRVSASQADQQRYSQRIQYLRECIKDTEDQIQKLKRNNGSPYYLDQLAYRKQRAAELQQALKSYRKDLLNVKTEARKKGLNTR